MLTFFCGKMGAGKTTLSKQLASERSAVLISEDVWLAALYPNKIHSLKEYVFYSNLIKPLVKELVQNILGAGGQVVMDFPANTVAQRQWFKSIYSEINADHELYYIRANDEVCLERIARRAEEQPDRAAADTKEMFLQVGKYFVEPMSEEGFNIVKF